MAPTQAPLSQTLSTEKLEQPAVLSLRLDASETLGKPARPLLALLVFHTPNALTLITYLWQKQLVTFGTWNGTDVTEEQAAQDMDSSDLLRLSVKFPSNLASDVEVVIVEEPQLHAAPKWAQAILPYIIPLDTDQPDVFTPQPLTPPKLARQISEKYAYENGVDLDDELFEAYGFDILPGGVRLLIRGVHSGETLPTKDIYNSTLRSVYAHLSENQLSALDTLPATTPIEGTVLVNDDISLSRGRVHSGNSTIITPQHENSVDLGVPRRSLMPFFEYGGERFVPVGRYNDANVEDRALLMGREKTLDRNSRIGFVGGFDRKEFYEQASTIGASFVDVFLAKDGKQYVPCEDALYQYIGKESDLILWESK